MAVSKGDHPSDPRGLIYESYNIAEITTPECRSIFFDWALDMAVGKDMKAHIEALLETYGGQADHPMTAVLNEGMRSATAPKRRGGARNRRASDPA